MYGTSKWSPRQMPHSNGVEGMDIAPGDTLAKQSRTHLTGSFLEYEEGTLGCFAESTCQNHLPRLGLFHHRTIGGEGLGKKDANAVSDVAFESTFLASDVDL